MTQTKTSIEQGKSTSLAHMIQLVSTDSDLKSNIPNLLHILQELTGAVGAAFIIFDDPKFVTTHGICEAWEGKEAQAQALSMQLTDSINFDVQFPKGLKRINKAVAIAPLRNQVLIGALWLSFAARSVLAETQNEQLLPYLQLLSVIAQMIKLEDSRARSHQLTLSVLSSITDPLLVLDNNDEIVLLNPAAEKTFNITDSLAHGRMIHEVVQSDELTALVKEKKAIGEWITPDDKTYVPRIAAIYAANGEVEGSVLALRDITQFKKLNRNQSEFMRIVSHDLRSPLTSMQGFASMLELGLVGELNEKQKHFVSKILAGITQMTALVDNIQDAGRYDPETGFYDLSRSQVDLGEMAHRIVDNHLVPAEKALAISVSVADDVPIINADANMLERAIINLFDNAIKYTPDGGRIEVSVKRNADHIIVSVRDTGLGISMDAQQHLFERHVRIAREEHKRIKGSGLGLFIVRSVAQRHGGNAWVESVEGQGSTFFLGIPLDGPNRAIT